MLFDHVLELAGSARAAATCTTAEWEKYGRGRDPRCDNCMAHCGYEPTAVLASTRSPKQALRAVLGA